MYIKTAIHLNKHEAYIEMNQSNGHENTVDIHLRNSNRDWLSTVVFEEQTYQNAI